MSSLGTATQRRSPKISSPKDRPIQIQLQTRIAERDSLIERSHALLKSDPRISGAWLTGSLSRDDHDALSDVDLWVVVSDASAQEIVAGRRIFVQQVATPSLLMDNLKNAPPSGGYLLVHYPGSVGPHHFDWFWQPESLAQYPSNGKLLFDRVGLDRIDGETWQSQMHQTADRPPTDAKDSSSLLAHKNEFFWAMSLIVAKCIARHDSETAERMLQLVSRTLAETIDMLGNGRPKSAPGANPSTLGEQFAALKRLTQRSQELQDEIAAESHPLPDGAIDQITAFFDLALSIASNP